MTTKTGTLWKKGNVFLNWLDTDTGERGVGYFNMNKLCESGYGDTRMVDIVVMAASEKMET